MVIEKEELKYYNDLKTDGFIIDWDKVFKYYNELGCPTEVYNPAELPINEASWFVLTSERNTGKTTNLVLIAMIIYLMYGSISAYIRQKSDMITPKELANFMNVILQYKYIEKLTDGKYNGVRYWARYFRLVRYAEDGTREEESNPFLWCGAVNENLTYKSSLNLPLCNMIIYDEFIGADLLPNEFVSLTDLHKTIARNRFGLKIFLCANTTNYYHEFFRELIIQEEVLNCKTGQSFIKKTPLGTHVYYKMLGDKSIKREKVNTEYYGFPNPKLKSITGGDWSVNNYPHIPPENEDDKREILDKNHFIIFNGMLLWIKLVYTKQLGIHCIIHKSTSKLRDENIIYTVETINQKNERYKQGTSRMDAYLWNLRKLNKWYYADNNIGFTAEAYVNRCIKLN